jgi:hypothetical protein
MKKHISKKKIFFGIIALILILYVVFSHEKKIENPEYGVSFNTIYAQELGLNWKQVYDALFEELQIKKIRLAAHWNMVEPLQDTYSFQELDYQIKKATEKDAQIVLAVGKRLPRWPECHVPEWALNLSKEEQEKEILQYIEEVVNRYKDSDSIIMWQVENEPFLSIFAKTHCFNFDEKFLEKEIELVRSLDEKKRPILITDSGELSTWRKSFSKGDVFGTTMYVYSWNGVMGEFRNPFLPGFYSVRSNIFNLFTKGERETIIAELALEPWLDKPVIKEQTAIQIKRMSPEKFETVIDFAKKTGMKTQYLWGAEWWYYMKLQGQEWYWERGKELFK